MDRSRTPTTGDPPAEEAVGTAISGSTGETLRFGRRLGAAALPGTVIATVGPLGAGKTQLAKGVADGLGVPGVVNSPTFILMNEHAGRLRLFHVDAYRLEDPEEALAAGLLDERQGAGVTVIEWADRLDGWLPAERLDVIIEPVPAVDEASRAGVQAPLEGAVSGEAPRRLRWRAHGAAHAALAALLRDVAPSTAVGEES